MPISNDFTFFFIVYCQKYHQKLLNWKLKLQQNMGPQLNILRILTG